MKLETEQLITLDDNKKYIITSEIEHEENKYFLLAGVLEDESNINNEFLIGREVKDGDDAYIEDVTDEELIKVLLEKFQVKE